MFDFIGTPAPNGTTVNGYGGQPFLSGTNAALSHFDALGNGSRHDSKCGYDGTASDIARRYIREGRQGELDDLLARLSR